MKATVGRIVHYTNLGDKDDRFPPTQQAAIVTTEATDDGTCDLAVIYRTGLFFMEAVPYSEEYARGHWSWPPRV